MQTGATDLHFAMASKMRPRIFRRHIHIHASIYIYIYIVSSNRVGET